LTSRLAQRSELEAQFSNALFDISRVELFDVAEIGAKSHECIEAVKRSDCFCVVAGVLPCGDRDGCRDIVGGSDDLLG